MPAKLYTLVHVEISPCVNCFLSSFASSLHYYYQSTQPVGISAIAVYDISLWFCSSGTSGCCKLATKVTHCRVVTWSVEVQYQYRQAPECMVIPHIHYWCPDHSALAIPPLHNTHYDAWWLTVLNCLSVKLPPLSILIVEQPDPLPSPWAAFPRSCQMPHPLCPSPFQSASIQRNSIFRISICS